MKGGVSRSGKAPGVFVVGRLIDVLDKQIDSVAAATTLTYLPAMAIKRLPAGFIVPAQPALPRAERA
jgi:hypothetical protein